MASLRGASAALLALALAGCGPVGLGMGTAPEPLAAPTTPVQTSELSGATFGTGPTRVALILPLTQGGQPSAVG
ncbi:MAG TPA: hypothetical protein VIL72_10555, partial [Beijerinckiaceae bacterium]